MNNYPLTPELLPHVGEERPLRILVGWDQSGEEALDFASWLARTAPCSIRVVSTAPRPWTSLRGKKSKKFKKWFKQTENKRRSAIRSTLKDQVPREAWDKDWAVFRDGSPRHELISAEAREFQADLILLGSKSKAKKGRFLATSTADAMMHYSPVSVGLAPRAVKLSKKGITRVNYVFLEDRKEASIRGMKVAATVAMLLDVDLRIMAFSPRETYSYEAEFEADAPLIDEWNESSLALLDRARDCVSDTAATVGIPEPKNFEVETCVSSGDGWKRVVDSQKWKKGDILFLDSQPTERARVLTNARTEDFLAHAPVPVVIFP